MSYKLGLARNQYGFTKDHDVVDHFERMSDAVNSVSGMAGIGIDTDPTLAADSDTLVASQKATKEYVDTEVGAVAANVGTKYSYYSGGNVSGTITLPTIAINETMMAWYTTAVSTNVTLTLPATGTFNIMRQSGPNQDGTNSNGSGKYQVAGGSTLIAYGNAGFISIHHVTYTRTA